MTVGLESFTDTGVLQFAAVDQQDIYVCVDKGSGTSTNTAGFGGNEIGLDVAFDPFDMPEIVAVRSTDGYAESSNLDGISILPAHVIHTESAGQFVEWWSFKRLRDITMPANAEGLEVFNADGSTAYHTDFNPFIVAAKFPITDLFPATFHNLPSGRTYASVFYGTNYQNLGLPFPAEADAAYAVSKFSTAPVGVYQGGLAGIVAIASVIGHGGMIIVDVTDL